MKTHRKAFTLVELTLAMAFLSILLITITILVVRITGIYQHGLSIRAVGSTGRQIIDDFSRTITSSPAVGVAWNKTRDEAITSLLANQGNQQLTYRYYFQKTNTAYRNGESLENNHPVQFAGAFCTGLYTYIWNTAYGLDPNGDGDTGDRAGFTYKYGDHYDDSIDDFRLIKIPDSERSICIGGNRLDESGKIKRGDEVSILLAPSNQRTYTPVELIADTEDDLALYSLNVFPVSTSHITGDVFYSSTFILATLRGGIDITRAGDYCSVGPGTLSADFNYCAINKFNFAMRASGDSRGGSYEQKGE